VSGSLTDARGESGRVQRVLGGFASARTTCSSKTRTSPPHTSTG
jgi:hypothetical protein